MRPNIASCVFLSRSAAYLAGTPTPDGGKRLTRSATTESANSSTPLQLNQSPNMRVARRKKWNYGTRRPEISPTRLAPSAPHVPIGVLHVARRARIARIPGGRLLEHRV